MRPFELVRPDSLAAARAVTTGGDKRVLRAGGIDLLDRMQEGLDAPSHLVELRSIRDLPDLRIRDTAGPVRLGALLTLAELADASELPDALRTAAAEAATPGIRNTATLGGNLLQRPRCWYFRREELVCARKGGPECLAHDGENRFHAIFGNDKCAIVHPSNLAPALMVMDAYARTVKPDGSKRKIPIAELFVTPEVAIYKEHCLEAGEIVEDLVVPPQPGGAASEFLVLREKQSFDWPLVAAAVRLQLEGKVVKDSRIVLGAVCPVPLRRQGAEKALAGKELDEAAARAAGKAALEGATPLAQNGYKVQLAQVLTARAILAAASA